MTKALTLAVRGLKKFNRELEQENKLRLRNVRLSFRVELNRLRKLMKKEIVDGAPGGKKFAPLSKFATLNLAANSTPLKKMGIAVRYWEKQTTTGEVYSLGFLGGTVRSLSGSVIGNNQISKSWMRLARLHQSGRKLPVGEFNRGSTFDGMSIRTRMLLSAFYHSRKYGRGKKRGEWKSVSAPKFMFIRKDTTHIKIPARPIVEPFWAAHGGEVFKNIRSNFERKMRGERI